MALTEACRVESALVSVVIVSYNSGHVLGDCLRRLPHDVEVIVVDNDSADDSVAVARAQGARVLPLPQNVGFGKACNLGAKAASGDFILFINPDISLEAGAVARLREAAGRYPRAGVLAPRIVNPGGEVFCKNYSILCPPPADRGAPRLAPRGDCSVEMLLGAALFCRRSLFLEIGGFDERIFLYYEDDDLCRRFRAAGWSLVHVHDAVARHGEGKSSRPQSGATYASSFHWAVSKTYVARKYGIPLNPAVEWAKALIRGCLAFLRFDGKRRERYFGLAAGYLSILKSGL